MFFSPVILTDVVTKGTLPSSIILVNQLLGILTPKVFNPGATKEDIIFFLTLHTKV